MAQLRPACDPALALRSPVLGFLCGIANLTTFDLAEHMQRKRVPFAIWVTLWAIIVVAALALIITLVAWFTIP